MGLIDVEAYVWYGGHDEYLGEEEDYRLSVAIVDLDVEQNFSNNKYRDVYTAGK